MKDASSNMGSELKELNDESDPCEDTLRRTNLMKLHLKCAPKNKSSALRLVLEPRKLLDIKQLDSSPCVSPMSQLAANLNGTQISTPTTSRRDFGDNDETEGKF
ncbi:unnamed protein product [Hermetia illucens]|uniref:Uncharacterized protein n=1 Tax=Hermetia illucens TaxID=343691 RepID=A0A7R8UQ66_HERIL|nr:unnamed protein product [Hermetia illucens]